MGEQEYIGGLGGWLVQRSPRVPEILYEFRETVLSKFASVRIKIVLTLLVV